MDLFNWYIQDGLLYGDLCLVNMRQIEYRLEKNTYKTHNYIQTRDIKYNKTRPNEHRFHLFVKLKIIHIENNIATVIYEKHQKHIILQNMDSFFFFDEVKKRIMEETVAKYRNLTILFIEEYSSIRSNHCYS